MKKIIFLLSFTLIFSNISFSQYVIDPKDTVEVENIKMSYKDSMTVQNLEEDILNLKSTMWMETSMLLFSHSLGSFYIISTNGLKDPDNLSSFLLFNTIGVGIDIYMFGKLGKIHRKKKQIKLIKSRYGG